MVVEFFTANQALKGPTRAQPQKPQTIAGKPEVIVFPDGTRMRFTAARDFAWATGKQEERRANCGATGYGDFFIRFDGMRSLGGASGRRASHSAVRGESALAFVRRWIWVSILAGRPSGAGTPSGRDCDRWPIPAHAPRSEKPEPVHLTMQGRLRSNAVISWALLDNGR